MLTNEIVGLPIVNDDSFPSTLDRLTEKVKAEKGEAFRKKPKKHSAQNSNGYAGSQDRKASHEGYANRESRKRKSEKEQYSASKRSKDNREVAAKDEKPDWKLLKQERKKLKESRKLKKAPELYELSREAKLIWEKLRQESCPAVKRAELSKTLYFLIKPHLKKLVHVHDIVRVIECLVAVGEAEIRSAIFEELKPDLLNLTKNKYSHFFVLKMLKYGDKAQRSSIMTSFEGEVVKLLRSPTSAAVVECAYNEYANATQRARIVQEFFGPEFRLFKDEHAINLNAVLEKYPERTEIIVKNFKQNILNVISKAPWKLTIVHTLLKDLLYSKACDEETRSDLIELLKNDLVHILHTRDGARVAMMCLWHGTPKIRKAIVKTFKTHVEKICTDEQGYMVMLALFDSVDDTILVSKAILQEVMESIESLLVSEQGRKVILYLLQPRNQAYFHPQQVAILTTGDNNQQSKKDRQLRGKELRDSILDDLLGCFERNLREWIENNKYNVVLKALLETAAGSTSPQYKLLVQKLVLVATEEPKLIEVAPVFKIFKALLIEEQANPDRVIKVTEFMLSQLESCKNTLISWLHTNRGMTIVLAMLERFSDLKGRIKEMLKPHLTLIRDDKFKKFPARDELLNILISQRG